MMMALFSPINHLPLLLIILITIPGCEDEKANEISALDELQGTWIGSEVGNESFGDWTFIVEGNSITVIAPGNYELYVATIVVDNSVHPHSVVATIHDSNFEEFIGEQSFGLYSIDGNHLTITAHMPGSGTSPTSLYDGRTWELYK